MRGRRHAANSSTTSRSCTRTARRPTTSVGQGRVRRVVLERDLKREYQQFLQAPNRERRSGSGRPARDAAEIARWAAERHLPEHDGHVQFPDARVEYERADGRLDVRDLEVVTPH